MSENGPKIVRKCVEKCQKGPKIPDNLSKIKSPKILVNGSQNVRNWVNECPKIGPKLSENGTSKSKNSP